ncbi:hypothetical protein Nepgr_004025 [Nepenthes gracilis]|uniref:Uncharacterized protein n=1 Tax=Nepenthes gracilis TaxID=150966 RepID=A0AAD3S0K0_NEPGR|nr:hypothetical protein Nepgr_004025 [Nepenthes gracilis]
MYASDASISVWVSDSVWNSSQTMASLLLCPSIDLGSSMAAGFGLGFLAGLGVERSSVSLWAQVGVLSDCCWGLATGFTFGLHLFLAPAAGAMGERALDLFSAFGVVGVLGFDIFTLSLHIFVPHFVISLNVKTFADAILNLVLDSTVHQFFWVQRLLLVGCTAVDSHAMCATCDYDVSWVCLCHCYGAVLNGRSIWCSGCSIARLSNVEAGSGCLQASEAPSVALRCTTASSSCNVDDCVSDFV